MSSTELIPEPLRAYLPLLKSLVLAVAMLVGGWIASRWVHGLALRAMSLRRLDQALARFLASILRYLVLAATVIAAMDAVGIHTTSLVAILASAGLAVGLALQGSLSNFASGVLILFFRPFHLGDKIGIGDKIGVVDDIGLFTTTLISASNEKLILPNTTITGGPIVNYSDRGNLKGTLTVGLEVSVEDVARASALLVAAARRAGGVAAEPAPSVLISDMEDGAADFSLAVWYKSIEEQQVKHNLRLEIMRELHQAGMKMKNKDKVLLEKA